MICLLLVVYLAAAADEITEVQHLGVIGEAAGEMTFQVSVSGRQPQRVDWTFMAPSGTLHYDRVDTAADGIVSGEVRVREAGLWQGNILVTNDAGQTCKKFDFVALPCGTIFLDGFESGDTSHWTTTIQTTTARRKERYFE